VAWLATNAFAGLYGWAHPLAHFTPYVDYEHGELRFAGDLMRGKQASGTSADDQNIYHKSSRSLMLARI